MAVPVCEDCFRDARALYFNTSSSPGTWYCDLHVPSSVPTPAVGLARREGAAATPPIPSGSSYCSACGGTGWIPAPCTACAAATPRAGGGSR
jgi:hypothetical protein